MIKVKVLAGICSSFDSVDKITNAHQEESWPEFARRLKVIAEDHDKVIALRRALIQLDQSVKALKDCNVGPE